MIISVYTSKGGGSKTTTIITILSALAQFNAANPENPLSILALDLDGKQASLGKFEYSRQQYGRPSMNITFKTYDHMDVSPAMLAEMAEGYDITIVDAPGYYDESTLRTILVSDLIIVPTNLTVIEYAEASESLNRLTTLRNTLEIPGNQALLLTRIPPLVNATPVFSKTLFGEMLSSGHAVLNAKLSYNMAFHQQMDFGVYLYEVESDQTKSVLSALKEAGVLMRAIMGSVMMDPNAHKSHAAALNALGRFSEEVPAETTD